MNSFATFIRYSFVIILFMVSCAHGADIESKQMLDFGIMAIPSNASESSYQIRVAGGDLAPKGTIYPIEPGQRGEYELSGFTAGVPLQFDWPTEVELKPGGNGTGEPLLVSDFKQPEEVVTDSEGKAFVPVGANLRTTGSGTFYMDTVYSGSATLDIQYWSETVKGFVTHREYLSIHAEPRTAIDMEQVTALNFGMIAAYADDEEDKYATMTLTPKGKIQLTQVGNARITPIHKSEPGLVRITGAVTSFDLNIDATQSADTVYLSHEDFKESAARFILEDIKTLPSGQGRTDSEGTLVILVGATLRTEVTEKKYREGVYEGQYELTVSY